MTTILRFMTFFILVSGLMIGNALAGFSNATIAILTHKCGRLSKGDKVIILHYWRGYTTVVNIKTGKIFYTDIRVNCLKIIQANGIRLN